jgi:hypothetical protein
MTVVRRYAVIADNEINQVSLLFDIGLLSNFVSMMIQ